VCIRLHLDTPQQVDAPPAQAVDGGVHDISDPGEHCLADRLVELPDGMKPMKA
jgi:hypothetical protein